MCNATSPRAVPQQPGSKYSRARPAVNSDITLNALIENPQTGKDAGKGGTGKGADKGKSRKGRSCKDASGAIRDGKGGNGNDEDEDEGDSCMKDHTIR